VKLPLKNRSVENGAITIAFEMNFSALSRFFNLSFGRAAILDSILVLIIL
jgi:hypothetical protein